MQQLTEEKKSCDQALIGMTSEHKKLQRELHAVQIRAVNKVFTNHYFCCCNLLVDCNLFCLGVSQKHSSMF